MKRISFFLALTLVILSFGLANADRGIHVIQYSGMWSDGSVNYINTGQTVAWNLRVVNDNGLNISDVGGFTYVIKSADAHWTDAVIDTLNMSSQTGGPSWGNLFSTDNMYWWSTDLFTVKPNGSGEDTVSYAPVSFGSGGIYDGLDAIGLRVTIGPVPEEDSNKVICLEQILGDCTTSGYEGTWIFLTGGPAGELDVVPGFWDDAGDSLATGAEICYTIKKQPDIPPSISGPWNLSGSHCALITADYDAVDPDGSDVITFSLNGAPAGATIDPNTGAFEWQPSLADVGTSISFGVVATESDGNASDSTVNVVVTNQAPVFTDGCKAYPAQVGVEFLAPFTATDNCPGDPKTFFVADAGALVGPMSFSGNVLSYTPDAADAALTQPVTVLVGVTDGVDADTCEIQLNISVGAPFAFRIEKTENTPQGQFVGVNMWVDNNITDDFGGFKFVVAYDASALTFQGADVDNSPLYQQCDWEYFTYRFGPDGNCGSGCPSGILTVTGYAEANDGPHHPTCWSLDTPPSYILFTMNFLVSNDRTLECSYVPIRFFWFECGDNTVSNASGDQLYVSSRVMEYVFDPNTDYLQEIQDDQVGFPTYQGFQATCPSNPDPEKPAVKHDIDFVNGGVDIVCSKDIDDRGDINLDGLPYTIADAVMFTNYFIYGLSAFGDYPLGAIAASDINADGMTLTVADLVYLIRVIVGDAQPYATGFLKPATVDAVYHINNGVVSVEEAMGAAVLHIAGDATPVLLADNMEMKYAYNAEKNITSAVVYSLKNNNFVGDFVDARGDVIDIEMATAKGNPVNGQELPSNFALFQNYPNPFNPATTISFALASSSDYHVEIYNLVGQLVKSYAGHSEAGTVTIEWDASNNASGVYFYKLTAGNFTATKKMVLLK